MASSYVRTSIKERFWEHGIFKFDFKLPSDFRNVTHANKLFGENVAGLRGKTVCQKLEQVVMDYIPIPQEIVQKNKYGMLIADEMFDNNLPFVVTCEQGIRLITAEFMPTHTATYIIHNLTWIITLYTRAGFVVQIIILDIKCNKVVPELPKVVINTSASSEHMPDVGHKIRVIKKWCRASLAAIPFQSIPNIVIINLAHFCVFWLNTTPVQLVCHKSIFQGSWYAEKNWYIEMVKTHVQWLHWNSQGEHHQKFHETQTWAVVCMGPTGKFQG